MVRLFIFAMLVVATGSAFRSLPSPSAGDISGTWKRATMTMIDASGKTTDLMALMNRSLPCSKDITYTFTGDGNMTSTVPDACGAMKKTLESMNGAGHWTMSGQKLTVTTTMKDIPTSTYDVSFQGNSMTWVFNYADNPKVPNPTKAKQMTFVYQRA